MMGAAQLHLFAVDAPEVAEEAPIVFELQSAEERPRTLVETPDDVIEERPEEADFLSNRNALARNSEADSDVPIGEAFSRGLMETHELPSESSQRGEQGELADNFVKAEESKKSGEELEEGAAGLLASGSAVDFSREDLTRKPQTNRPGSSESIPRVRHDNQASRSEEFGQFSLNTYDWEWAPYVLAMRRRINGNLYPPAAFFRLGIIDGETILKFKIYPSGELRDLTVIRYNGHTSLKETSVRAVEVSADFPPLPQDFPSPYLEVTGRFVYVSEKLLKERKER